MARPRVEQRQPQVAAREMQHEVDSLDRPARGLGVADVADDQLGVAVDVLAPAGREVVEHAHLRAAPDQGVDEVGPDEAGAAGHQHGPPREAHARVPTSTAARVSSAVVVASSNSTTCRPASPPVSGTALPSTQSTKWSNSSASASWRSSAGISASPVR